MLFLFEVLKLYFTVYIIIILWTKLTKIMLYASFYNFDPLRSILFLLLWKNSIIVDFYDLDVSKFKQSML